MAVLGFNYFFLPPVGTFTIADPENWVALTIIVSQAMLMDEARHSGLRNLVDRARDIQIMIVADRIADQTGPV